VVLAIELLLFEWKPRSFIPVAAAAAVAALLRVPLLGPGPLFPLAAHAALGWGGLVVCLLVGVLTGGVAVGVSSLVYGCEDWFARLPVHWMWWPTLGGVAVGIGGLLAPRALGVGYDVIRDLLQGAIASTVLLPLLIVKAVIWVVALGSGTSGGVLAPLLIMGGALGSVGAHWAGAPETWVWAAVAMGAMIAGTMHAPFTAIIFMAELTGDASVLPGLLIACVSSAAVAVLGMPHSILTEKLARRGRHVTREYIINPLHLLRVADVMQTDVPTVPATLAVDEFFRRLAREDPVLGRRHAWPLVDEAGRLVGILTRGDLVRALEAIDEHATHRTVLDAGQRDVVVAYPDELLEAATERMLRHDVGRLPVVRPEAPTEIVGYLGRAGVMAAWLRLARDEQVRTPGWLSGWFDRARRSGEDAPAPR
jgi:CIC family chloride channel protein